MTQAAWREASPDGSAGSDSVSAEPAPADAVPPVRLLGLNCDDRPLELVAREVVDDALSGQARRLFFVNAHCVNVAAREPAYRRLLESAARVYADGVGMRIGARLCGTRIEHNVNGTDLFPEICAIGARRGLRIALLGASPGVARACADRMQRRFPGLEIAACFDGYLGAEKERAAIAEINGSGAHMLFVAKGVPTQEYWIRDHAPELQVPVLLGVGALFDFYSGAIPRAPLPLRRMHLEWAFRLAMEPRRMFRRYVIGNPEFLLRVLARRLQGRHREAA